MSKLFVALVIIFVCYTAAVMVGSAISTLIGLPITFLSIWGILLVSVISAFMSLLISTAIAGRKRPEDEHD